MKRMIKQYTSRLAVAFTAIAVVVSGCSDDFTSPESASGNTIVQVASASADFNILTKALTKTGLAQALSSNNSGEFTVFAPTDDAFVTYFRGLSGSYSAYTEADVLTLLDNLSASSTPTLAALTTRLSYHIISSRILSSQITGTQVFNTQNNTRISISKNGADVLLNANGSTGAKVIAVDNKASNGVIHSVDRVAAPSSSASVVAFIGLSVNYSFNPPLVTTTTSPNANYDIFRAALVKTGLAPTLLPNASPLPEFTVLAPTDAAFLNYFETGSESTAINAINAMSGETLANFTSIIKYHLISGRFASTDLSDNQSLTTLDGAKLTVVVDGSVSFKDIIGNTSAVSSANNFTNAGILHGISQVLQK